MFIFFFFRGFYVLFKIFDLQVHTTLRRRGFMPPWNPKPTLLLQRYNLENTIQDVPKLIDDSYWFLLICTLSDHLHSGCTMCWLWHPNPDSYALPIWPPVPLPPSPLLTNSILASHSLLQASSTIKAWCFSHFLCSFWASSRAVPRAISIFSSSSSSSSAKGDKNSYHKEPTARMSPFPPFAHKMDLMEEPHAQNW